MSKKYSAHKTFNTNFECHKMFSQRYKLVNLARGCFFFLLFVVYLAHVFSTFFLTFVSLKNQFNCFFKYNESASVTDHLNSAKKRLLFGTRLLVVIPSALLSSYV